MRTRLLGRTGWRVSEIGYGAWQIGGTMWGEVPEERAKAAVRAALDSGITFLDTALAYGDGRSERLIGQVLRERGVPGEVIVATKVPPLNREWPARPTMRLRDVFPARWIRQCAEQSLRNLGLDRPLDLLQLHVWTDAWAADDEWYEALLELRERQRLRAFGVSVNDHEPASALEVTASGRIDTIQVIYNVFDQTPEAELFPAAERAGVGVIVRVPLDEGSLAGTLRRDTRFPPGDMRARYFAGDRLRETVERVERLQPLLEREGQSMAQGALRFCLTPGAVSTVIVGSVRREHIEANAAASDPALLEAETLEALRSHAWPRNFYP